MRRCAVDVHRAEAFGAEVVSGSGNIAQWPCGIGAKGNEGATELVSRASSAGALTFARVARLPVAAIANRRGEFVEPTLESIVAEGRRPHHADPDRHSPGETHLTYAQGACAEVIALTTIAAADLFGLPVSTTPVLSSGVAGTMAANRSGLQLQTLRSIALAWILTLPATILIAGVLFASTASGTMGSTISRRPMPPAAAHDGDVVTP